MVHTKCNQEQNEIAFGVGTILKSYLSFFGTGVKLLKSMPRACSVSDITADSVGSYSKQTEISNRINLIV